MVTYRMDSTYFREIEYPDDTRTFGMVSGLWVSMYALGYVHLYVYNLPLNIAITWSSSLFFVLKQ